MLDKRVLELTQPSDPYRDFCLRDYLPQSTFEGKLRSSTLLFASFLGEQISDRAFEMCDAIRSEIGDLQTVFGVKREAERCSWEFYFYDYRRYDRKVSASRVFSAIGEYIGRPPTVDEDRPYFMFSFEFDADTFTLDVPVKSVDVYIDSDAQGLDSGLCYSLSDGEVRLKNVYFFYDARSQVRRAWLKARQSMLFDGRVVASDDLLWSELLDCSSIVVANKQQSDGLYYSGLNVDQFLGFFRIVNSEDPVVDLIRGNRALLDHLNYDVGLDFISGGRIPRIVKTSYFGLL